MPNTPSSVDLPSEGPPPPELQSQGKSAGNLPPWMLCLGGITLLRLFLAAALPLFPEEAYHWCYARHPALSYYDHPPMIAWAISLGRMLFGDHTLGVRILPLLLSTGTTILLARLALRLYGERAALWTVLLMGMEPIVFVATGAGFPDSPMLFFWTLALSSIHRSLETGRGAWWLAAGAALGAAMLSKYTACFLTLGILGYLATSPRHRFWLASPWPYLAGVLSLLVFAPVLIWNATHDWASFKFQSVSRFEEVRGLRIRSGFTFLLGQWLGILPLTLPLAIVALKKAFRSARWEDRYLFWIFAPMFAFFFALSWTRSIHLLWPLPAYMGLTVLMSGTVVQSEDRLPSFYSRHARAFAGTATVALVLAIVHLWIGFPGIPTSRDIQGWDQVARRARELRATLPPGSFYLGLGKRYLCPSQLSYHLNAPSEVHGKNLLGEDCLAFNYWSDPPSLKGKDAIVVVPDPDKDPSMGKLRERFESVTPLEEIVVDEGRSRRGNPIRFGLFSARGYIPPERPTNR
jgi:dolichol-phosphate mannosyltransferase